MSVSSSSSSSSQCSSGQNSSSAFLLSVGNNQGKIKEPKKTQKVNAAVLARKIFSEINKDLFKSLEELKKLYHLSNIIFSCGSCSCA